MNATQTPQQNPLPGFDPFAPPGAFVAPQPQAPPQTPWWQRDGVVSRLLAGAGVAVTLIGVVMLLVVAARAGLFGPWARVSGGAVLSGALVIAGWRVFDRRGGHVGGIALAGTGIAGFFMVVVAVTTIYGWVPPVAGLALAAVVAAASIALAMHWNSQMLAVLVTVAVAALAPVLIGGLTLTLVGFLVLLQVVGVVPEYARDWPVLCLVRSVPAVIALLLTQAVPQHFDFTLTVTAATVVAVTGLVTGMLGSMRRLEELTSVAYAVSAVPMLVLVPQMDRPSAVVLASALAAATVVGAVVARPVGPTTAAVAAITASLLCGEAAYQVTTGDWLPALLVGLSIVIGAIAYQLRSSAAGWSGLAFFVVGFGWSGVLVPDGSLMNAAAAVQHLGGPAVVTGLLIVAGAAIHALQSHRADALPTELILGAAGVVAAYGVTLSAVAAGTLAAGEDGFRIGHLAVTVSWMVAAMLLLAHGLRHKEQAKVALTAGLTVVAAALAKLFLFDLAALGGMTRAFTFIAVGLLLLLAGSRYAQAMASPSRSRD